MILFKYSAITEYFITNLKKKMWWFSPPTAFNDPYDSRFHIDWDLTDKDILNELDFHKEMIRKAASMMGDFSSNPEMLESQFAAPYLNALVDRGPDGKPDRSGVIRARGMKALESRRRTIGISCFTQDFQNEAFWAHYADLHHGVCLGIEPSFDKQCFQQLEEVKYVDILPKIKLLPHMKDNLIKQFTTKTIDWSSEREIRAFQHRCGQHRMNPRCLLKVFFGMKVQPNDAQQIVDIVRREYGSHVEIFQMNHGTEGRSTFRPWQPAVSQVLPASKLPAISKPAPMSNNVAAPQKPDPVGEIVEELVKKGLDWLTTWLTDKTRR